MSKPVGKILYGLLFCGLLPFLLVCWSYFTEGRVGLKAPDNIYLSAVLLLLGLWMVIQSMTGLFIYGKGLPMNAFPPENYIRKGWYRYFNHPIYIGACLIHVALSMYFQSKSAFWLVSPVLILSCVALVYGYENGSIKKQFNLRELRNEWSLPVATDEKLRFSERWGAGIKLFIPWLALYELRVFMGASADAIDLRFDFEKDLPVYQFTEISYTLIYPWLILFPFFARTKAILRSFLVEGYLVIGAGMFILYLFPFTCSFRIFVPDSFPGEILAMEQLKDSSATAFPSFHVLWTLVSLRAYLANWRRLKMVWIITALAIIVSCVTTGMHSIADVALAIILYGIVYYRKFWWNLIKGFSQRMANSWKEWHVGPIRIINHSLWPGLACFVGISISQLFLHNNVLILIVCICAIISAGLWGQFVEGSRKLLRPFGYYGSIIGGVMACVLCSFYFKVHFLYILTSLIIGCPWIQAIGRFRCWVQGCCHGSETNEGIGIIYLHPKSRVSAVSGLQWKPLHNTQLYSIVSNVITGLLLLRLVWSGQSTSLICGVYFILNGLARFVEEAYRGEAQTKRICGLRMYQWMALASVIGGAVITCVPYDVMMIPQFAFNSESLWTALGCGLFTAFVMGMDFPKSNVRFSRLAE